MSRLTKPPHFASPQSSISDLIDQLEVVLNETVVNNTIVNNNVNVESDSIDYDWIKDKVKEEVKTPVWKKYQAVLKLEEFENVDTVTTVDIAKKINEVIAALKA